jgi:hypothetical protein
VNTEHNDKKLILLDVAQKTDTRKAVNNFDGENKWMTDGRVTLICIPRERVMKIGSGWNWFKT